MLAESTIELLFMSKVAKDTTTACWNWTGAMKEQGYGQFTPPGRGGLVAHRWGYEHFVGPIARDLVIDHLCRNRRCVNPEHLEAVTQAENMRRWKEAPLSEEERQQYEERRRTRKISKRSHINKRVPAFFHNVEIVPSGCWLWWGSRTEDGYGIYGAPNRAHRVSYELFIGPIPDGMQIDHLCRVRHCVNPGHLEAVTARENTLRGHTITALNAQKTHCPQGHLYDTENIYLYKGERHCRECGRQRTNARMQQIREDPERFEAYKEEASRQQHEYKSKKKGHPLGVPNSQKTECLHGHAYTPENTLREADGSRKCRICVEARQKRRYTKGSVESTAQLPLHLP